MQSCKDKIISSFENFVSIFSENCMLRFGCLLVEIKNNYILKIINIIWNFQFPFHGARKRTCFVLGYCWLRLISPTNGGRPGSAWRKCINNSFQILFSNIIFQFSLNILPSWQICLHLTSFSFGCILINLEIILSLFNNQSSKIFTISTRGA